AIAFPRSCNDHASGTQHAVAQAVALLEHFEHRSFGLVRRRPREHRLVDMRVELAVRLDLGEAFPLEHGLELAVHQPHAVLELCLLVLLGRLERPLEVVHDREQLLDETLGGARRKRVLLAGDALAVVLELRSKALEVVQVRVGLGFGEGKPLLQRLAFVLGLLLNLVELFLGGVRPYDRFASSSTTSPTIPASSIPSSSEVPPLSARLPPPDEACAAVACA